MGDVLVLDDYVFLEKFGLLGLFRGFVVFEKGSDVWISEKSISTACARPLGEHQDCRPEKHRGRDGGTAAPRRAHALRAVRQFAWLEAVPLKKRYLIPATSTSTGHNASR
jgi:hypothetical protein